MAARKIIKSHLGGLDDVPGNKGRPFDRPLFGHTIPSNWLQTRLFDPGVAHWYDYVTFFVYLSHFFVTILIAALLWRYRYPLFRRWRAMVLLLAAAGFAGNFGIVLIYVLFLLFEQKGFDKKLRALFPERERRDEMQSLLHRM